jgi:hypothetical protein
MLEHSELLRCLHYCQETGAFTWRCPTSNRVRPGTKADCKTGDGYIRVAIKNKRYLAHRLAWFYMHGVWPEHEIDHINRNRSDNRACNLRLATRTENARNIPPRVNKTSGVKGVHWSKKQRKWVAQLRINGKQTYIGASTDLSEALRLYTNAVKLFRGDT